MASTITWYDHAAKLIAGDLDLKDDQIDIRLVTSGYTFSAAHTQWDNGADDATDPSYNEVSNGDGYTTGGETLTSKTLNNDGFDAADVTWTSLTKTFRAAIAVAVGTFEGVTNPVLFYLLPDSTPADIVSTGSDYTIIWNAADGIVYFTECE